MALRLLGTKSATQLACLNNWSLTMPPGDLNALGADINDDQGFGRLIMGVLQPSYVLATATTASSTTLTVVTARAGSPAIGNIQVRDEVLGSAADFVPGTCVTAVAGGGATVTIAPAALSTGTLKTVAFLRQSGNFGIDKNGLLWVPGRGMLKVLPGDVVADDSTGWPILISGNSIAYAGSDWTLT
ncbi:MAG TPA: hypothetical protein VF764_05420 [Steroidobacteraceae bacterium]